MQWERGADIHEFLRILSDEYKSRSYHRRKLVLLYGFFKEKHALYPSKLLSSTTYAHLYRLMLLSTSTKCWLADNRSQKQNWRDAEVSLFIGKDNGT